MPYTVTPYIEANLLFSQFDRDFTVHGNIHNIAVKG